MSTNPVLGEVIISQDLSVHLNCLYAASGLVQRVSPDSHSPGFDTRYISGFDVEEIKMEVRRGSRLRCRHCGLTGACIGCSIKRCRYSFHLPCIFESKGFVRFKKSFDAFCYKHRPKQDLIPHLLGFKDGPPVCCVCLFSIGPEDEPIFASKLPEAFNVKSAETPLSTDSHGQVVCTSTSRHPKPGSSRRQSKICRREIKGRKMYRSNAYVVQANQQEQPLWMRCFTHDVADSSKASSLSSPLTTFDDWCHGVIYGDCCRLAWMHRDCIAGYARSAGLHHVKCPICFDRDIFIPTIVDFGVWVPDRDPSWELELVNSPIPEIRPTEDRTPYVTDGPLSEENLGREPAPLQNKSYLLESARSRPRRRPTALSANPPIRLSVRQRRNPRPSSLCGCSSKTYIMGPDVDEENKENVDPLKPPSRSNRHILSTKVKHCR